MRQFLRENTCKTQLGAKFGARRVKSMFRYCINVGERDNGVLGSNDVSGALLNHSFCHFDVMRTTDLTTARV